MIDLIADYRETVGERPVAPDIAPGDVRAMLPAHPPTEPEPWLDVAADIERVVMPTITHWQHPGWFAYFPANTSYSSILGELLAAGLGVQGMSWITSPACTEIETLMLDWMQELLGLPDRFRSTSEHGGGVIQGSASEAIIVAIMAARWRATGGAVNTDGDTSRLVAYGTTHTHSSFEKGLRIAGIGTDRIRLIETDEHHGMRPDALRAAVEADRSEGLLPFFACSTHGTTSSLAFDPTDRLAEICEGADIWLHVDAAMSGIAALDSDLRWVNDGLDRADSYCTNAHKWMGVNFDCSLFWTADRSSVLGALSILPEYLRSAASESGAAVDYRDWQIPLGRRFRALKLWFTIRLDGVDEIRDRIRRDIELTQELAGWVAGDDRFEVVAPHQLNLLCLRLSGASATHDIDPTDTLIDRINASGRAQVTRTVLDGNVVMRVSIGARTTRRADVEALWDLIRDSAEHVDR